MKPYPNVTEFIILISEFSEISLSLNKTFVPKMKLSFMLFSFELISELFDIFIFLNFNVLHFIFLFTNMNHIMIFEISTYIVAPKFTKKSHESYQHGTSPLLGLGKN